MNKTIIISMIWAVSFIIYMLLYILDNQELDPSKFLDGVEFASIVIAAFAVVSNYLGDIKNRYRVKSISSKGHTTLFGVGKFNRVLLENEIKNSHNSCIVVEKDKTKKELEYYKQHNMGVIVADVFEDNALKKFNFENMESTIVAIGNDRLNIELSTMILEEYKKQNIQTPLRLLVHIINQDFNILFHKEIEKYNDIKIEITTFSFYEEVAQEFFKETFVDGNDDSILKSNDDFSIVVAGDGYLAQNIVYQASLLAHLPNENRLKIFLLDKEAKRFKNRIIKKYPGILNVVDLETLEMDYEEYHYFTNDVWKTPRLSSVIICYDDDDTNISITIDLFNKTFLKEAIDNRLATKISFAVFNSHKIAKNIDTNKEEFKQFHSFGDENKICTKEHILDEDESLIAKLIHYGYDEKFNPMGIYDLEDKSILQKVDEKWFSSAKFSDKLSSKAQALHIDMKLKAMGLKREKSNKTAKELIDINRKIFDKVLHKDRDNLGISDKFLQDYSSLLPKLWDPSNPPKEEDIKYFPKEFTTLFEKLIRMEHNRWDAYHYLHGWSYNAVKNKAKKDHDCLMPLKDFKEPKIQLTVIYDIYAILYIPNYLANAGYEMDYKKSK